MVLAHGAAFDAAGWEDQAVLIAERNATVVAVEDISPAGIAAAVDHLRDRGVREVALVGGSAGADAILQLASEQPDLPDQLVLLSPTRSGPGWATSRNCSSPATVSRWSTSPASSRRPPRDPTTRS